MKTKKNASGFTLIELMIGIAVVAILTTLAVNTYSGYMIRAYRSDVQATLIQGSQYMERIRLENGSYKPGGVAPALPATLAQSPASGTARYSIALNATSATTFTLTATPGSSIATQEICGNLIVDHSGLKTFSAGTGDMKTCWGN